MPVAKGPIYAPAPLTARSETTKLSAHGDKLVWTNGRAVVIHDLKDPHKTDVYTEHVANATVARISPSGYYCASGDTAGNVRIWDITNPAEHILKFTTRPLAGRINDLAWDSESKRIVVAGEGRDKQGAAFFMESGSSCGEITGHGKPINAIDVRHNRPFRAVTASDDTTVCLHTGVPFKYDKMLSHHSRFVRDVRYSPDGESFASVGSDGKLNLYDGKSGELKQTLSRSDASLMGVSWAKDSKQLATAGADGVVAIWDVASGKETQTYTVGSAVEDQQNGIAWVNESTIASISLDGTINLFDPREASKWRKLHGPTKGITAGALLEKTFYAGSLDGSIKKLDLDSGAWEKVEGSGHSAKIAAMVANGGKIVSAAWDDRALSIENGAFAGSAIPSKGQPTGVATSSLATLISSTSGLVVQPASGQSFTHAGSYTAVGAAATTIAFGSGSTLTLAKLGDGKLETLADIKDSKSDILTIAFSPDGSLVAAGDAGGRIVLVDVAKKETLVSSRWTFHSGRVLALAFSPDGERLASAGLDESVYIWDTRVVSKNTPIKNAHPGGVTAVAWVSDDKLVTGGTDGCARTWTLS